MRATKRLLVVEDDRPIADLLKHHFSGAGFTVTTTPSTPSGTSTITVTASGGGISHSIPVTLTVKRK